MVDHKNNLTLLHLGGSPTMYRHELHTIQLPSPALESDHLYVAFGLLPAAFDTLGHKI